MSDESSGGNVVEQPDDGIETISNVQDEPQPAPAPKKIEGDQSPDEGEDGEEGSERTSRRQRQRDRLKAENDALRQELAKFQAPPKPTETKPIESDKEPQVSDYTDVLDYLKAQTDWKTKQAIQQFQEQQTKAATEQQQQQAHQAKEQDYFKRLEIVREQVPDISERVNELYQAGLVTPELESAVLDAPLGEKVTQHFVENPQELQMFRGLNKEQTYMAIGLLQARLLKSDSPEPVAKTTKAAAPIVPLGKQAVTSTKSLDEMDQEEYEAYAAKVAPRRY